MLEIDFQYDLCDWFLQFNLSWLKAQIEECSVYANEIKRYSTAP